MNINDMTKKDFQALPLRKWDEDIGSFDCLIILPTRSIHDSGYRCMDFVAVKKGEAICRLSGCSDVINIDGIGGYGEDWKNGKVIGLPKSVIPKGWSIDCLHKSGLLRIFADGELTVGQGLSSFEIYAKGQR